MHVHYTKRSLDSVSIIRPVMLAKVPWQKTRHRDEQRPTVMWLRCLLLSSLLRTLKSWSCSARAIYYSLLQFLTVVNMFRPGYLPPTWHREQTKADLNWCASVMAVRDGWFNIHNEPITAMCLLVDDKPYLPDSFACGTAKGTVSNTSDNYKELSQNSSLSGQRENMK